MDREKTKLVEITFEDEILGVARVTGMCPVCKKDIDPYNHPNYCGHCGQSIRWVGKTQNIIADGAEQDPDRETVQGTEV